MELMSSMRFAISLLTVISVASVIGTVLKQNEPYANYLNQFGPFWFPLFGRLGLYSVYNAWWFLVILAFLVGSTSLCVWRNAPIMLREVGRFRENLRERAFDNFPMRASFGAANGPGAAAARVQALTAYLAAKGFSWRTAPSGESTLIAAKAGMYRRVGYVFAHSAIVMICLGGLADSEVSTRMAVLSGAKTPVSGSMRIADVPPESRLSPSNWSFRGNLLVPEGQSGNAAVLNLGDGVLVQDLPFTISLKRFQIEHYSTGQPKLFASDVIVTDRDTGKSFESRIEVNKPLIHKGIAVYQSGFDDGGTLLRLTMRNLLGGARPLRELEVRVGDSFALDVADAKYTMELTGFRPINVENVGDAAAAADAGPRGMFEALAKGMGSAAPPADRKRDLRNVGPSYQYKLRDAAGQAREYSNYMLPLPLDGRWYLMTGVREQPADPFRFLRLPLDEAGGMDEYARLRSVLLDGSLYAEVGRRFASAGTAQHQSGAGAAPALSETMRTRLAESAARVLETFSVRGYQSVAAFLEQQVPEGERDKAAEIYIRILQGAAWEAWQLARERAGLPRLAATPERGRFIQDGLNALSDTFFYGVPLYMQLDSYEEVKASVFQLTRSPGKPIVYWGCALLVLGIFAMFYLRERRLWLLVHPDGATRLAFTSNRRTLDVDEEFAGHRNAISELLSKDGLTGAATPMNAAPPAGA